MKKINKDNLDEFINYYHSFNDSNIVSVNYDILNEKIEIIINTFWSGEPVLKEDNTFETNKTKIKMVLSGVIECNNKEMFSWDDINEVYLKYIKLHNKEYICFASDKENPSIYVVCDSIEYEEVK